MLEILLACAPLIDPITMGSVVKQESGGHPWTINNNTTHKSQRFDSQAQAVAAALDAVRRGDSVDLGLAQINSKNLGWLGLSVEQVFEPCTNVAAGAQILKNGYDKTGSLQAALSMYNTGKPDSGVGANYAKNVYSKAGVVVPAIPGGQMPNLPNFAGGGAATGMAPVRLVVTPSPFSSPLSPVTPAAGAGGFTAGWR